MTSVGLTAIAAPGSIFTGWGGACLGTGPCTVNISGVTTVSATFALLFDLDGNGQVDALTDGLMLMRYIHALAKRSRRGRFRLRKATFKGRGLSAAARGASWEELREQIYKGRGG